MSWTMTKKAINAYSHFQLTEILLDTLLFQNINNELIFRENIEEKFNILITVYYV